MKTPTVDALLDVIARDELEGWCKACGSWVHGIDPDARRARCECCGELAVYGAEEMLIEVAG